MGRVGSAREGAAGQLPDHELQVLRGDEAVAIHIKHREDEAQPVLARCALAGRHQRVHKLLQRRRQAALDLQDRLRKACMQSSYRDILAPQ